MSNLSEDLRDRVLEKLGLQGVPEPTLDGLSALYRAWGERVPFDNVRKLIHVAAGDPGVLPGDDPVDFLEAWLRWGTGGTCWSGAGGLHALLRSLGFHARRGVATMLVAPGIPPNHGTVVVDLDGDTYLVDQSILHGEPLRLRSEAEVRVDHPAWGVQCRIEDGHWHIRWRPMHMLSGDGLDCRIDYLDATRERFSAQHEMTREWSPFNFQLSARRNRGDSVIGAGFGNLAEIRPDESTRITDLTPESRRRLLIEDLGMSEEIVDQLPPERATPPPPESMRG